MPKSTSLLLSATIVSSLLLAACSSSTPTETPSTSSDTTPQVTAQMTPAPTQKTSDGMTKGKEVTKEVMYPSPAGQEKVGFTLVVDDKGVITDTKTQVFGIKHESVERQQAFADGLSKVVVGKSLKTLANIDRVGGSSLTTNAFNDALKDLKAQL